MTDGSDTRTGRTLLERTTWCQRNMWPAGHGKMGSDSLIHHIHSRVLKHIKGLAGHAP